MPVGDHNNNNNNNGHNVLFFTNNDLDELARSMMNEMLSVFPPELINGTDNHHPLIHPIHQPSADTPAPPTFPPSTLTNTPSIRKQLLRRPADPDDGTVQQIPPTTSSSSSSSSSISNQHSQYHSKSISRRTRILADGSTESEERVINEDGSQQIVITHCDALRNCQTTVKRLLADGTSVIEESLPPSPSARGGNSRIIVPVSGGGESNLPGDVRVPLERSGLLDRVRSWAPWPFGRD
jgi:hypothetical protein